MVRKGNLKIIQLLVLLSMVEVYFASSMNNSQGNSEITITVTLF